MIQTEDEINAELEIVSTAITNIMLTGQKYEIGSGPSKRVFEAANINNLQKYRSSLNRQLKSVQGKSGMQIGF